VVLQIGERVSVDQMVGMLRYFVEQDPDCIRERDDNGDSPLHVACRKPAPFPVIQYLVQQDSAALHISKTSEALPHSPGLSSGAS